MASTKIYSLPFTLILYFFYTHHLAGLTGGRLLSADIYHLQLRWNARSKQGFRSSYSKTRPHLRQPYSALPQLSSVIHRFSLSTHQTQCRCTNSRSFAVLQIWAYHSTDFWRSLILPDPNSYSPTVSLSLCSKKPFFLSTRNCNERQRRDAKLRGQEIWPATTSLGPHESMLSCRAMRSNL